MKGCYRLLRLRVVDYIRKTEGRTRWKFDAEQAERVGRHHARTIARDGKRAVVVEHSRRTVLSLDASVREDPDSSLGEVVAALVVDASTGRDEALGRALRSRDSEAGRPSEEEVEERLDELAAELLEVSELTK